MKTTQLSSYAPEARRHFIEAVTAQAAKLGISAAGSAPAVVQGDVLVVGGHAFPKASVKAREALLIRVKAHGFHQTMEAIAYTWFNRFVAIRYMELHGYLDHGYRVLSHPEGQPRPEILDHAADVDLPGLDREKVTELKLDGTQDEELYRMLLKAQCNALNKAMPFLFEEVGASDELLLPANLLHTDSLIRQLVESIDEDLWQEIEIIGWLYQFYISEKKDEVIGKVVKSEDIPAATQLFTPNWIVKYMVQNSLGAQWLATYPNSPLKGQMEYYIEPAEQTDEVNAQLAAITPRQLNPEELTLIDPASGSGHILVEAYELLKAIYLERGYRQRDVPQLILEKNLFGLDIDERAAQLTGFALMMKGRADDRQLFERGVKLNVMAVVDSTGFDAEGLAKGVELSDYDLRPGDLTELKRLFEHATTFGSLILVPEGLASRLPALKRLSEVTSQDLFVSETLKRLGPLVRQAELLAAQYDAVVANPPYMGSKYQTPRVKSFAKEQYPDAKGDLFACFIERGGYTLAKTDGRSALVTMQSWMFLASFRRLREQVLREKTITTMAQIGYNSFPSLNSKVAQATVFSMRASRVRGFRGTYWDLNSAPQSANKDEVFLARDPANRFSVSTEDFEKIPGLPLAYWASRHAASLFEGTLLGEVTRSEGAVKTGDNDRYIRFHWEVNSSAVASDGHWRKHPRGGEYRKWYGNVIEVLDWHAETRQHYRSDHVARIPDERYWDLEGICWSEITSAHPSFRTLVADEMANNKSLTIYPNNPSDRGAVLGFLNTSLARALLSYLNPTLALGVGDVLRLPWAVGPGIRKHLELSAIELVELGRCDWDAYERSWDFQSLPLLTASTEPTPTLESSYTAWITQNRDAIAEMKRLEEENNRLFIDAYGLADELTPDVPIVQITLTVNPAYRYSGKLTEEEQWTRFRQDTMEELVSYAIGCMMGRYSLDAPGLIYAHSGNEGFDPSQYTTFPADDDGIVPLTDTEWFEDDACNRAVEFLSKTWRAEDLEDNLTFLADNLSPKKNESSRDTIRSYINDKFFKDHLQTYKKRPIYWLFSSGKQKAFQCLVYLHRYNEGTLSRMRSEYVIPLQGKIATRLEKLEGDIQAATSTAQSKRLEKERAKLEKQQVELLAFDEKLRHYADMRISLDLDDGVKVNYGNFGDLLAEVASVHGKKAVTA